jgi:hypothetical protein
MAVSMEQYGMEPVLPFALEAGFFIGQGATVWAMVVVCVLIPVWNIGRLRVTDALYR